MDNSSEDLEDLAAMRELRQRLRVIAKAKLAECEAMGAAKDWLDMNRQIRAIMAADRMIVALYSQPPKRRTSHAKRSTSTPPNAADGFSVPQETPTPPSPPHFPNGTSVPGEVARRSRAPSPAKSVTEGYSAAETASPSQADDTTFPVSEAEEDAEDSTFFTEATAKARATVEAITYPCAQAHGLWPDGAPFDAAETAWEHHTKSETVGLPPEDARAELWLGKEVLTRVNAIAKHYGRKTGRHLDGQPYQGGGSFALSVNFGAGINRRAANETPARGGLPWWIVRKPPP